jgi:hypothetical protein
LPKRARRAFLVLARIEPPLTIAFPLRLCSHSPKEV